MSLQRLVVERAQQAPDSLAVHGPHGALTYGALDQTANRVAHALAELGVGPGDRVALWTEKSVRTVAAMQGILRAGAAYVPLDPLSPLLRVRQLVIDCGVKAVVTTESRGEKLLTDELATLPSLIIDGPAKRGVGWADLDSLSAAPTAVPEPGENDLAYILYTSGSTGKPKGVCISHKNALAFAIWAAREVALTPSDRLSNHAPFHFDLSVFDLYSAFAAGASVRIIPEGAAYAPGQLVELLNDERLTVWYSVPSALILMMEHGRLLDSPTTLRTLIFAGEVFPIKHLRRLRASWPGVRFWNWYGPTETNVCTSYEVTSIADDASQPVPIGQASCGDRAWAVRPDGQEAAVDEEGELYVSGPTVMLGYYGHPPHGDHYRTGDLVKRQADGNFIYIGRRDHMVKVRGHRVELGEIESALLVHPDVEEAAVVVRGSGGDARLVAYLAGKGSSVPLLAIKRHLSERLPPYMIVDEVRWQPALPRTGNGKIDRKALEAQP